MGTEKVNETLVKYLAGLFDADGSLSFSFRPHKDGQSHIGLILGLASSDAIDKDGFVPSLPALTGMGGVYRYGKGKRYFSWRIGKRADLEMLLPRLIKHMVLKAQHWQWLLDVWREKRAHNTLCSFEEREELTGKSRESRKERVGPIRPKNHPTWAWLAGYLDGDGWYLYRSGVYNGYRQWSMSVGAVAHNNDISVLQFLQRAFGGVLKDHTKTENVKIWVRSLGYQNRDFALNFLPNVAKHSRFKRNKIDAIIHHHQQRLSVPGTERRYCTVDGCDQPRKGRGLCSMHYQRHRRGVSDSLSL